MGIYASLLEDTINDLDSNNDGYKETKELMDVIDDQEINIEEIEDAQDAEFGPDDVSDILDEMTIVIAESEMAWNSIVQAIGIRELNEAANGDASEATDKKNVKDFFSGAKNVAVDKLTKVIATIKKWANGVISNINFNKRFVEKNRERIIAGAGKASIEGYQFKKLDSAIKVFAGSNHMTSTKAFKLASAGFEGKSYTADDAEKDLAKLVSRFASNADYSSTASIKKSIVGELRGNKENLAWKPDYIMQVMTDGKGAVSSMLSDYTSATKEEYKKLIKAVSAVQKGYGRKDESEGKATAVALNGALKAQNNMLTLTRSAIMSCVSERISQCRKLANAYIKAAKGEGKGSSSIDESFQYGYLTGLNLI